MLETLKSSLLSLKLLIKNNKSRLSNGHIHIFFSYLLKYIDVGGLGHLLLI